MPSLFIVMLGGRHARANIEVHDVVFAVGDDLPSTYSQLKNAWFGEPQGLHIDAWIQCDGLDFEGKSYQIQFSHAAPAEQQQKLYLINLGGYDPREFGELHRYVLVIASNPVAAKAKGKAYFATHWQKQHTDRVLEVDDCLAIDLVGGHFVHLQPGEFSPQRWENSYITL
ncbi:DUF1543 domain-containing protein [Acinetobacter larvae]|uniref:DUF1543 domain-containing protein n=1 Tax=Acinetobacter larvae TaxID=1789224 RepID=A0A1B2M3Y5_9GAMM|nr:DUF1543 domain-containing protein [Acinetobacter larvae]AOA59851.1 hypothetical protein BFG52_03395 [Acinetobacter larvae]